MLSNLDKWKAYINIYGLRKQGPRAFVSRKRQERYQRMKEMFNESRPRAMSRVHLYIYDVTTRDRSYESQRVSSCNYGGYIQR